MKADSSAPNLTGFRLMDTMRIAGAAASMKLIPVFWSFDQYSWIYVMSTTPFLYYCPILFSACSFVTVCESWLILPCCVERSKFSSEWNGTIIMKRSGRQLQSNSKVKLKSNIGWKLQMCWLATAEVQMHLEDSTPIPFELHPAEELVQRIEVFDMVSNH